MKTLTVQSVVSIFFLCLYKSILVTQFCLLSLCLGMQKNKIVICMSCIIGQEICITGHMILYLLI